MILNWFPQWGFFTLVQLCREAKALVQLYVCTPGADRNCYQVFRTPLLFVWKLTKQKFATIALKLANDTSKHLNVDMRDKLHSSKHLKGFFGVLSTCTHD